MPRLKLPAALPRNFYDRPAEIVARELLGKLLIARVKNKLCVGRIVETEAYLSQGDAACHAHKGITRKNAAMFGPPGHAYVYAIHSRWCFNTVTEPEQTASAVLIRAVEPLYGLVHMQARRSREALLDLARGPGRLCEAFGLDRAQNHWDLTRGRTLWIGTAEEPDFELEIRASPRIGISQAQDLPLRFFQAHNRFVSGKRYVETRNHQALNDQSPNHIS